jgi:hypothetical protein
MREDITLASALPAANELLGAYRTHFCGRPAVSPRGHPARVRQERRTSPISGSALLNSPICPYDERDRVEHCQIAHFEGAMNLWSSLQRNSETDRASNF